MTSEKGDIDAGLQVSTREDVTAAVTTVSYTMPSTTISESSITTGFENLLTMTSGREPRTPITDPTTGWIYGMNKEALITEMQAFGLSTSGNVETLRRRFCKFWRDSAAPLPRTEYTTGLGGEATGWSDTGEQRTTALQHLTNESVNVREILRLSPNSDTAAVRRVLTSLVSRAADPSPNVWSVPRSEDLALQYRDSTRVTYSTWAPRVSSTMVTAPTPFVRTGTTFPNSFASNLPYTTAAPPETRNSRDCAAICQSIRKWNLKFDGKKDPVSFVERLDEMMEAYGVPEDEVVKALPELLSGFALLWYRNTKESLVDYQAFRQQFELQFFPPGYHRNLDEEVRARTQGEHESFRDFVIAITTLLRRSGSLSRHSQLDLIYKNMKPEYKIMVRRQDCVTLTDLIERAEDYEAYIRDKISFRPPPPPAMALVAETAYVGRKRHDPSHNHATVDGIPAPHWTRQGSSPGSPGKKANTTKSVVTGAGGARSDNQRPLTVSSRGPKGSITCWNCRMAGHISRDCRQPRQPRAPNDREREREPIRHVRTAGNGNPARVERGHPEPAAHHSERAPTNGTHG